MKSLYLFVLSTLFLIQCNSNENHQHHDHEHEHASSEQEVAVSYAFSETTEKVKSNYSVNKTAENLQKALMEKGMNIFVTVKHHQGAAQAGLELRPTITVVFGNPKIGTRLMQCSQTSGIDQPMKALIWEDENGDVWLAYNTIEYLTRRHGTADCASEVTNKIANALVNFAKTATE